MLARVLGELDRAVAGGDFDPARSEQEFTLAAADAIQLARLPRIAARLAKEMPRARLRVVSVDTLHATGGLAGTLVDLAVGAGELGPGVHAEPLYEERILLVARNNHPRARGKLTKSGLSALRHVEVHVAPGMPNRALAASYKAAGVARAIALVVPTYVAAAAVIAGTDLVGALPESLVGVLAPRLGLHVLTTPLRPVTTSINLLFHERVAHDPAQLAFRALVKRA